MKHIFSILHVQYILSSDVFLSLQVQAPDGGGDKLGMGIMTSTGFDESATSLAGPSGKEF